MSDIINDWIEFYKEKRPNLSIDKEKLVQDLYNINLLSKDEYADAMYDIINEAICPKCGKAIDGYSSIQGLDKKHYHRDCFYSMEKDFSIIEDNDRTSLEKVCKKYIDATLLGEAEDSDLSHYIFEEALKYIYGSDIFDKLYKR